jgi:hypothetical protein
MILILLLPSIFLLLFIYILWINSLIFSGEDFETSQEAIKEIAKIITARGLQNGFLYDLGSCRGGFVFKILNTSPDLRVVGIDNSRLKNGVARFFAIFRKYKNSPKFTTADIFKANFSAIDMAFIFLPRALLLNLETKLQKELKPGALVITYRVNLPNWRPDQIVLTDLKKREQNNIFVYLKT